MKQQPDKLDPTSAATIGRFILCGIFVLLWYTVWHFQNASASLSLMGAAAGAAVAATAARRGERMRIACLTHWDEAAAWLGIAALAHAMNC